MEAIKIQTGKTFPIIVWALVSESDNRAPDCPIVRFAGVCTKSDVVNLVFEPDAR